MKQPRAIVFFDIDGTLLDPTYKPNSNELPALIAELENQGVLFGCNSNRSKEDLVPILEQFGIHGPVIAENGIFWFTLDDQVERMLLPTNDMKDQIKSILNEIAEQNDATVSWTDTVQLEQDTPEPTLLAYFPNRFRKYTASIHVFESGKRSTEAANKLAEQMKERLGDGYQFYVSDIFSNVLIYPKNSGKVIGLRAMKKIYPKTMFIGIGDDSADLPTIAHVDKFFSVANAEESVKQQATYVATKPYTLGVVEILRMLDKWL